MLKNLDYYIFSKVLFLISRHPKLLSASLIECSRQWKRDPGTPIGPAHNVSNSQGGPYPSG
jgi:hypothetical protein